MTHPDEKEPIPVFITVRTASTRLHAKWSLKLGDCNVLEHVIRRCLVFGFAPIVCTPQEHDGKLAAIARNEDVDYFPGDNEPKRRWLQCADHFDIYSFHALDCDDPYFDPLEIERSFSYLQDLNLHCVLQTKSSEKHALGMMGISMSLRPGETRNLPERRVEESQIRLTLDYPEDYWLLSTIARFAPIDASREDIEDVCRLSLTEINFFRDKEWKERQLAERSGRTV